MYSFPNLEPIHCFTSSSNCCFLTCIQVSQEAGKVVWHSHLFKNFPQFVVIHIAKGFSIVNEVEVDVFLKFSCFFYDQWMLAIWSLFPLPFLNPAWTSGCSPFTNLVWGIWHKQMEWYINFLVWKNQYCENNYTTQSNIQIQCNPFQITNDIFNRT